MKTNISMIRSPGDLGELIEGHRPGNHEHGLDVEHDEQHGHQVELDREPLPGIAQHRHARLIGGDLGGGPAVGGQDVGQAQHQYRVGDNEHNQQQERDIGLKHERQHLALVNFFTYPAETNRVLDADSTGGQSGEAGGGKRVRQESGQPRSRDSAAETGIRLQLYSAPDSGTAALLPASRFPAYPLRPCPSSPTAGSAAWPVSTA